ncbi:hypothetical protein [Sutcliffiella halmapala]|uniref:hypothetical protein n=1 Tax=Sutcliffiella halmapala TaxID=79882 RepID=UPI0009952CA9|nr:hypothetical protein [Sutcliffiella halmapala]
MKQIKPILKEDEEQLLAIYSRLFIHSIHQAIQHVEVNDSYDIDSLKRVVFTGIKMINAERIEVKEYRSLVTRLKLIKNIERVISKLTPAEFQTIFPITKEYDGDRFGIKDYYHTKKYIKGIGEHEVIGDNVAGFLREYVNWDITLFLVNFTTNMSSLKRCHETSLKTKSLTTERTVADKTRYKILRPLQERGVWETCIN